MCDLPSVLNNEDCQPAKIAQKEISCIMWADDLVIFSESENGLQKMLNKLQNYADKNDLYRN